MTYMTEKKARWTDGPWEYVPSNALLKQIRSE